MLPHSRVELRRWFDSHKVRDCVAERGSGSTRDPLEAVVRREYRYRYRYKACESDEKASTD